MPPTLRRAATLAAATAAMILTLGAANASAGIVVNDNTPTSPQTLTATVSNPPTGANHYTIAQCNVDDPDPADWGRDCNRSTASTFRPISSPNTSIQVFSSFTNYSFVPGLSPQYGTTTTCKDVDPDYQCGVVVSWYSYTPGSPPVVIPVGTPEKADITF